MLNSYRNFIDVLKLKEDIVMWNQLPGEVFWN